MKLASAWKPLVLNGSDRNVRRDNVFTGILLVAIFEEMRPFIYSFYEYSNPACGRRISQYHSKKEAMTVADKWLVDNEYKLVDERLALLL
jgi:hypothetical protein